MPISQEMQNRITEDILDAYKEKFGERWGDNLTKNLRPSPIKAIAENRGVSIKCVRDIKQKIWMIGRIIDALNRSIEPLEEVDEPQQIFYVEQGQ